MMRMRERGRGRRRRVGIGIVNLTLTIITTMHHPSLNDQEPTPGRRAIKKGETTPRVVQQPPSLDADRYSSLPSRPPRAVWK